MKTILLVDSDAAVKNTIQKVFEENFPGNAQLFFAATGAEAIRMAEQQKFDCVITEAKLTKGDGENLVKLLTVLPTEFKPIHILILSSFPTEDRPQKKMSYISYLNKPFSEIDLLNFIKTQIFQIGQKSQFKMDVHFINPFIGSTLEVLKVTADTVVDRKSVYIKEVDDVSGDISAIVSMTCSKFVGSFAISFEKNCFLEIASKMLYEEFTEITNDNRDAIGELCNQIFGMTKAKMNDEMNLDIAKAIPAIIVGDKHTIRHEIPGPCLAVRFKTEKGSFTIEVVLRSV